MKKISLLLVLLALAIFSQVSAAGEIKWFTLKEGMEKSKAEKKPMIVDYFFGKGCPRCEMLLKNVYGNPLIAQKIMDDFIPIKIDLTKKLSAEEEELGNRFDFKNDCLLLFLDHDGNVIKDPSGKRLCFVDNVEPEWFIKYLDIIKAGYSNK